MPLCSDPDATVEFSLLTDRQKPDATRPVFLARFVTCRQMAAIYRHIDEAKRKAEAAEKAGEETIAPTMPHLTAALAVICVGWRNVNAPSGDIDALLDALTEDELWGLLYGLIGAVRVQEIDKKKSALLSASRPVDGAPSAESPAAASTSPPAGATPS